jgi:glycosyltransferase involved in cell wall biosynthesis
MRLLLLITDLELGGTPTVVRELAIRLQRCGVDVQVACLSAAGPVADQLLKANIPVTALNARTITDLTILHRLIHLIREQQFDTVFSFLIHANTLAAAASLRLSGIRWIQSIQTTQPWPRWHWMVQRLVHHAAEQIIVPSQSVAQLAQDGAGVSAEKIVVIANAVDVTDWSTAQSSIPATQPRPYPITFLGRLDPIKDVPTLVQAAAQLAPLVHLHVFGEGADRSRIEKAIAQFNAPATLHGAVSSPQEALSHSGLLVLPSLAEGFGLVLIEAMAAGVPVVGTNVPGIRDVIQHEQNGLLATAGDAISLAACIGRIVRDPALRTRLIDRGKTDVNQRYSWDAVLAQYRQALGF